MEQKENKCGAEKAPIKKKKNRKALEAEAENCEKLEKFFKRKCEGDDNDTGKLAVQYDDSRLLSLHL